MFIFLEIEIDNCRKEIGRYVNMNKQGEMNNVKLAKKNDVFMRSNNDLSKRIEEIEGTVFFYFASAPWSSDLVTRIN